MYFNCNLPQQVLFWLLILQLRCARSSLDQTCSDMSLLTPPGGVTTDQILNMMMNCHKQIGHSTYSCQGYVSVSWKISTDVCYEEIMGDRSEGFNNFCDLVKWNYTESASFSETKSAKNCFSNEIIMFDESNFSSNGNMQNKYFRAKLLKNVKNPPACSYHCQCTPHCSFWQWRIFAHGARGEVENCMIFERLESDKNGVIETWGSEQPQKSKYPLPFFSGGRFCEEGVPHDYVPYIQDLVHLKAYSGRRADFVFLIDASASYQVKLFKVARILSLFVRLFTRVKDANVRLAIATFRDKPVPPLGEIGDHCFKIIAQLQAVEKAAPKLLDIEFGGGGDGEEAQLDALLHSADEISWRQNSERMIVMFTDTGFHIESDVTLNRDKMNFNQLADRDPSFKKSNESCSTMNYPPLEMVASKLRQKQITVIAIVPSSLTSIYQSLSSQFSDLSRYEDFVVISEMRTALGIYSSLMDELVWYQPKTNKIFVP